MTRAFSELLRAAALLKLYFVSGRCFIVGGLLLLRVKGNSNTIQFHIECMCYFSPVLLTTSSTGMATLCCRRSLTSDEFLRSRS